MSLILSDFECRSSALADGLGWSQPLNASILANQLTSIGRKHAAGEVQDIHVLQQVAQAVPQIYNAFAGLGQQDMEMINAVLADSACVWVGNGFVTPGTVAFRWASLASPDACSFHAANKWHCTQLPSSGMTRLLFNLYSLVQTPHSLFQTLHATTCHIHNGVLSAATPVWYRHGLRS